MDNNKKISIEQDAYSIKTLLEKYTQEEKIQISRILSKEANISLNVYNNPTIVAVALIPVIEDYKLKLLGVRRGIMPFIGELAFPGGFAEAKETAAQAAAREGGEETGVQLDPRLFRIIDEKITPNNQLLVFCLYAEAISKTLLPMDFTTTETQEIVLLEQQDKLCFPLHNDVKNDYFASLYHAPRRKF